MGLARYLGWKFQDDFDGTSYVNNAGALRAGSIYLDMVSEGFASDNNLIERPGMMTRSARDAIIGNFSTSGNLEAVATTRTLGQMLIAVAGGCSFVAAGGPPGDDDVAEQWIYPMDHVPFNDFEIGMDGYKPKMVHSAVMGSLSINATPGDYVRLSADFPGARMTEQQSVGNILAPGVADIKDLELLVCHRSFLYIYSTGIGSIQTVDVESATVNLNAAPQIDDARLGSRFPKWYHTLDESVDAQYADYAGLEPAGLASADFSPCGLRTQELELTLPYGTQDEFKQYFYGGSNQTNPKTDKQDPLEVCLLLIGLSSTHTDAVSIGCKAVLLHFPRTFIKTTPANVGQRDRIGETVSLTAVTDPTDPRTSLESAMTRISALSSDLIPATLADANVLNDTTRRFAWQGVVWDDAIQSNIGLYDQNWYA